MKVKLKSILIIIATAYNVFISYYMCIYSGMFALLGVTQEHNKEILGDYGDNCKLLHMSAQLFL